MKEPYHKKSGGIRMSEKKTPGQAIDAIIGALEGFDVIDLYLYSDYAVEVGGPPSLFESKKKHEKRKTEVRQIYEMKRKGG